MITKKLIDCGAEINAKDSNGETALNFATKCGFPDIAKYIEEKGGAK